MTTVISREYHFSSAHILVGHDKCSQMHGHNFRLTVYVTASHLRDGMVIDFHELDRYVKPIVEKLDHHFIVTQTEELKEINWMAATAADLVYLPIAKSTAELLAAWIGYEIGDQLADSRVRVERIELWETPKSCAIWTPSSD